MRTGSDRIVIIQRARQMIYFHSIDQEIFNGVRPTRKLFVIAHKIKLIIHQNNFSLNEIKLKSPLNYQFLMES